MFAANVITAEGAASGIQHAHKSGKVKLATFDADTTQVADLKNGSLQLAIAQEPALEGSDAVEQGLNAINGKTGDQADRDPADRGHPAEHEQRQRQAVHLRQHLRLVRQYPRLAAYSPPGGSRWRPREAGPAR